MRDSLSYITNGLMRSARRNKPKPRYVSNASGDIVAIVKDRDNLYSATIEGRTYRNSHLCDLRQQLFEMGWL